RGKRFVGGGGASPIRFVGAGDYHKMTIAHGDSRGSTGAGTQSRHGAVAVTPHTAKKRQRFKGALDITRGILKLSPTVWPTPVVTFAQTLRFAPDPPQNAGIARWYPS